MKVLVTDGNSRAALAVTRSLGRAGHEVLVGERSTPCLSHASRFCQQRIVYPDPARHPDAFIAALEASVRDNGVELIMPVAEIATILVSRHRAVFGVGCRVPTADAAIVSRAADKLDVIRTAESIGVPVPKYVVATAPDQIPDIDFPYPVVVKPPRSRVETAEGWRSCEVGFADTPEQLRQQLADRPLYQFPLMIQERIAGPGAGVFACYHDGRPMALFSHRRLRERPPWGGVSVLCESAALDPVTTRAATRLLEAIGWEGVAMVEFKRDVRDGTAKLMEINGRFWGSLQLAIEAGVDFPVQLLETACGRAQDLVTSYDIGVRSRWLWGDIDALLLALFRPQARDLRANGRGPLVWDFLHLFGKNLRYENPRRGDLGPWWFETGERLGLIRPRGTA